MCPGIRITLTDKRDTEEKTTTFISEKGILDFLEFLKGKANPITKPLVISGQSDSVKVDVGIQYVESYSENLLSFVNMIKTPEGGTHVVGLHTALTRAITNYIQKNYKKGKSPNIEGDDTREGLVTIIALYLPNPEFEGQTKEKLGNPFVKSAHRQPGLRKIIHLSRGEPIRSSKNIEQRYSVPRRQGSLQRKQEIS